MQLISRHKSLTSLLVIFALWDLQSQLIVAQNANTSSKQTLIIVDKASAISSFKQSHSKFVQIVQDLGQNIDIKSADDTSLKLSRYGEFIYDNILVLCPQASVSKAKGGIIVQDMLEFIDSGRNLLLVGSHDPGTMASELVKEVGFDFKKTSTKRDYSNTKVNDIYFVVGDLTKYPSQSFSYSGAQMKMLKNDLTLEILGNNAPVDDIRPSSDSKFATNVLIGAVQARNNARVVVSGSLDFFSDKAFDASAKANQFLANELMKWLTKQKSLLRYSHVQHRKLSTEKVSQSTDLVLKTHQDGYTIMNDVEYSIKIEIFEDAQWKPYKAEDVQFEFVRVDPFVRQTMKHDNNGVYVARFKVPDVYGVYKMEVDYMKEGLTHLFSSTQVSVRPLRHDEYERFIYSAYPYYISAILMMAYLYAFSFVYLYQEKEKRNNK